MGLGLAIGLVGAAGSIIGGRKKNKISKAQAKAIQGQTYLDEEAQRREAKMLLGAQAAAMAQSGTGIAGSNELVMRQSAALAELDALNIRYRGLMQAKGLLAEGRAAQSSGYMSAGLSLLKGFASL